MRMQLDERVDCAALQVLDDVALVEAHRAAHLDEGQLSPSLQITHAPFAESKECRNFFDGEELDVSICRHTRILHGNRKMQDVRLGRKAYFWLRVLFNKAPSCASHPLRCSIRSKPSRSPLSKSTLLLRLSDSQSSYMTYIALP